MTLKRCLSAAVIAALVSGLAPTRMRAQEARQPVEGRVIDLRASIDRAVARAAGDPSAQASTQRSSKSATAATQSTGGGGGGHAMMIISLVSAVAGLGMTYYVFKQMQKTTDSVKQ